VILSASGDRAVHEQNGRSQRLGLHAERQSRSQTDRLRQL
jgi:hypothetical protein